VNRIAATTVTHRGAIPVEVDGEEFVVWRALDGRVCSAPRYCPHLDHDLSEGYVDGDELVCAGHGWAFDGAGHTFKRNEFGRVDPKGTVPALHAQEAGDELELERA
jgi:phenylpropionate dioxygenase-like ring-hydroxylating dioxygenase large terminal subunit